MGPSVRTIDINGLKIGGGNGVVLIAGPCVIESEAGAVDIAGELKSITSRLGMGLVFKASYDKANRTSLGSFRGPGMKKGLEILAKVREKYDVPVLSDVHSTEQVGPASQVLDIIQIPAFLSRQTDLLVSAGETGRVVNIKKGQFMAPWDIRHAINKVESTGNHKIIVTERGYTFGYNMLVNDFRVIPIMRDFGYPVVFDATHSVQLPSAGGDVSDGQRQYIEMLAKAGAAVGIDGLFLEVHPQPDEALSDSANTLRLDRLEKLLKTIKVIDEIIKKD
ncbi:MAG: 3-deoxy-8-phosphooctulonate synthase [Deltaproteobacteria bacterium]|nr:3-deoxy-8-phosphooctulonate synthase [Deltaproteobacteria bacterium]MCL5278078.1 3-deoxy-8-phosphooctulonate synthase [Deltaproteobacteria bacterium]